MKENNTNIFRNKKDMKTITILKIFYWTIIAATLFVFAFIHFFVMDESEVTGSMFGDAQVEFVCQSVMILLSLAVVYVATKFSKFKWIERKMHEGTDMDYQTISVYRLFMVGFTILLNIACYMVFVNGSFAWLATILYFVFPFIYPSEERYKAETGKLEAE